jgi:hypothetical protein
MTDSRATVLLILLHADLTTYEIEALHCRFCDNATWRDINEFTGHSGSRKAVSHACMAGIGKLRVNRHLLKGWIK